MASQRPEFDQAPDPVEATEDLRSHARQSFVTGLAIIVPALVTIIVLAIAVDFIADVLAPLFRMSSMVAPGGAPSEPVLQIVTLLGIFGLILVVGFLAERTSTDASHRIEAFVESIPGVGSVYTSFREMSEIMLDSETQSFQDVKLVEYPREGSYTVAFLTAETDEIIERDTGHSDMVTLFMPMAPNPVMGGFVIHVSRDQVVDVDLTVEEGIRSIVTSGVAVGSSEAPAGLSEDELRELTEEFDDPHTPTWIEPTGNPTAVGPTDRVEEYNRRLDAEFVQTPQQIAERRQEQREEEGLDADELADGLADVGDEEGTDEQESGEGAPTGAEKERQTEHSADEPDDSAEER